jgi:hypothetical protein
MTLGTKRTNGYKSGWDLDNVIRNGHHFCICDLHSTFGQIHDVWKKAIQIGNLIEQRTTLDILFEILGMFTKIPNMILKNS